MQRELHHWIPLLNYFDSYLEKHAALRHASPMLFDPPEWAEETFPKRNVLAILRTSALILKMCAQKQPYNSLQVRNLVARCGWLEPAAWERDIPAASSTPLSLPRITANPLQIER
jgi:hypothetical protein